MPLTKDVEQGLPQNGEDRPLLAQNQDGRGNGRLRPPRPDSLVLMRRAHSPTPGPKGPKLTIVVPTPTSTTSSPNSSPPPETADSNTCKKWVRGDRRLRRLNTELLEAIEGHDFEEIEVLLNAGANPNATCRMGLVSACHMAALSGGPALASLLKFGAEKNRLDKLGRTPLHLAAWAGNARQMAMLLDFPEDMHDKVDKQLTTEAVEDVRRLRSKTRELANVRCDLGEVKTVLPKTWKDNIDHHCRDIAESPSIMQPGWTPLHVAASCAQQHCIRLLLAAGADPNICDEAGRTPLDVAGFALYKGHEIENENFTEVIKLLLAHGGTFNTMRSKGLNNLDTPLHVAAELENLDAINELLYAGAFVACLNTAGLTPLHVCVKKELEEPLQILATSTHRDADPMSAVVDVKDIEGQTVLHAAVEAAWVPGVCIALEAGADVTLKANDGETPIHSAAALGNLDVLTEILSTAKQRDALDYQNEDGETPLFRAIAEGHLECVNELLIEGASIKINLPGDVNVLHVAAKEGHTEILKVLLEICIIQLDETEANAMINALTSDEGKGFAPIHFAASNNHPDCAELLLSKNADIRLRTSPNPNISSTPLHIAAVKNHVNVARVLLKFDKTIIHEVNAKGWFPLHTAAHYGSRDVVSVLLYEGADFAGYTDGPKKHRKTAIDMIINSLSKPTDFLEEVFDTYISTNCQNLQDPNCEITLDYRVLIPNTCDLEQMKVIEALLKTGNRCGQERLLVHPLLESFLYLKWKALLPFFYMIFGLYALFAVSLTIFTVSVFFYKDTQESVPIYLNVTIWGYIVYSSICLILLQELLYMNVKSSRYFLKLETWVKFGSICLAAILPAAVSISTWASAEWVRHVATAALLLAWLEMMFLLSRFPNGGYYVLMFGKVAFNVVKILLTFAFLVIGFSLSFMIQFRSQMPFDTPWSAIVKTMVMMTSEFDYGSMFDDEHTQKLATSIVITRIMFMIFLILAAIVLMNLLVGVAVNDINNLEILGNIKRLAKQVEFLGTLDVLVYNRFMGKVLPKRMNKSIKNKSKVTKTISLCPGKPKWRHYKMLPSGLRDAIFEKALTQKKQKEAEEGMQLFTNKIDEMYKTIVKKNEAGEDDQKSVEFYDNMMIKDKSHGVNNSGDIVKQLNGIDERVKEMKEKIETYVDEAKFNSLNDKINGVVSEIDMIKQILIRLETKLVTLR